MTDILGNADAATRRESIRVLIADDHAPFRRGLHAILDGQDDIEIVANESTGRGAARAATRADPHVSLLDVAMPDGDGVEAAELILAEDSNRIVVMMTAFDRRDHFVRALKAGARGYLLKSFGVYAFANAVRRAAGGDIAFSPRWSRSGCWRRSSILLHPGKYSSRRWHLLLASWRS